MSKSDKRETIPLSRIDDYLRAVFTYLKKVGGRARPKELLAAIAPSLNLSDHERSRTKTGAVRWENNTRWYKVDCTKAGYLRHDDGYWVLTPEGERALALPKGEIVRTAQEQYRKWKKEARDRGDTTDSTVTTTDTEEVERVLIYEQAVESARAEIEDHIKRLTPFQFQDLVAELLRAMGYHVRTVAPEGAHGVDVLAYSDPIGAKSGRVQVEVRHQQETVGVKALQALEGVLRKEGDTGLYVSMSGFTKDALQHARSSAKHVETMDLQRLVSLWEEHYPRLSDKGKELLPLRAVHFLAPPEE